MGYYIQTDDNFGKAAYLIANHGATLVSTSVPPKWADVPADKALLSVVNNGAFEAVALAFSEAERDVFAERSDRRQKWWLFMDKAKAHELSGYVEKG